MKAALFILSLVIIIVPASAWGIEIFGYKFGTPTYTFDQLNFESGTPVLSIKSDMHIDNASWSIDGKQIQADHNIKQSSLTVPKIQSKSGKNIIEYKAGKDKTTHKEIHKITVEYDGGVRTWYVLQ